MPENKHIEYKSNFNEEAMETLSAFANTKGGRVLVGVKNDGTVIKNFEQKNNRKRYCPTKKRK